MPQLLFTQQLRNPDTLLRLSLWAVLIAVIAFTRADPDLWGHVKFGIDILNERGIPDRDPYSFTSDRAWVNHEWAAEVFMGAAFRSAGTPGLVLLKLAVVCALLLLLLHTARQDGVDEPQLRDYLASLVVITTIQQAHHLRPQIFSLLFFAALLTCLTRWERSHKRALFLVPVLFGTWANFHGGWIVGGAVLMLWTIGTAMQGPVRRMFPYVAAGAASLIATLVNPYHVGLWQFLGDTVGFGRADITDWQPVYALDASIWVLWILTAAIAAVGVAHARSGTLDPARLLVISALGIASFRVNRLLAFFALATLFLLGPAIAALFRRRRPPSRRPTGLAVALPFVLAAVLLTGAIGFTARNLFCIGIDARMTPAADAISFLKTRPPGRLLVWFDWGQYAIWHLAPAFAVSTDGRRETVYSAELHERHLRFFFDAPGGRNLPSELAVDYVWIPGSLPAAGQLGSGPWARLYDGEESVIFARAPSASGPAAPPVSEGPRCFPGP